MYIPEDLKELYKLAQEAAPGEWCKDWTYSAIRHVTRNCDIECITHVGEDLGEECLSFGRYDGPYIAKANPDRIKSLIERIGKLELFRDESEAVFDGELGRDWADFFQTAWNLLQETKEYK